MDAFITATPYDDVFKTLSVDCKELLIPVINELFGEDYQGNEQIVFSQNEHFEMLQDGTVKKIITDSIFSIIGKKTKRYLYECQSSIDSSILIRIFEYISQEARENAILDGNILKIKFVNCGILYLRSNRNILDRMKIELSSSNGESMTIDVNVMKLQSFSLDEIFKKKLWFLLPFYLFTHEKSLNIYEEDEEARNAMLKEYEMIAARLNELEQKGEMNSYIKRTLFAMLHKVTMNLTQNYTKTQEGATRIMFGRVLEYEAKDILRKGIRQGREGTYYELIRDGTITIEKAAEKLNVPIEEIRNSMLKME